MSAAAGGFDGFDGPFLLIQLGPEVGVSAVTSSGVGERAGMLSLGELLPESLSSIAAVLLISAVIARRGVIGSKLDDNRLAVPWRPWSNVPRVLSVDKGMLYMS